MTKKKCYTLLIIGFSDVISLEIRSKVEVAVQTETDIIRKLLSSRVQSQNLYGYKLSLLIIIYVIFIQYSRKFAQVSRII